MGEEIYFQWQNEHLLKTIYPLREMKLRDFLVYFYEIDIWSQYKDKKLDDIRDEVQAYIASQRNKLIRALERHQFLFEYFIKEDVTEEYLKIVPNPDMELMGKINEMHKLFKRYFPTYKNPAKEKYFISERVRLFEEQRKFIQQRIKDRQRALRNMPPAWSRRPEYEAEVERLTNITPKMLEKELSLLYDFLASTVILERHKQEYNKQKVARDKEKTDIENKLKSTRAELEGLQARLAKNGRELERIKTPARMDILREYFFTEDTRSKYVKKYAEPDQELINKINETHKQFKRQLPAFSDPARQKLLVSNTIRHLEGLRKKAQLEIADKQRILRNMGPTWGHRARDEKILASLQNVTLKIIEEELNLLGDFLWLFDLEGKPASALQELRSEKEAERASIENLMSNTQAKLASQQRDLKRLEDLLTLPEKDQLLEMVEVKSISVKDIVRSKVDDFRLRLSDKNHQQLLEEIVGKFTTQPERYPLWLQYMVIHFSGMRYQSAHGSWADPKDLLFSLRIKAIESEIKRGGEDAIQALCEEKYQSYKSPVEMGNSTELSEDRPKRPKLASTVDKRWRQKIDHHLKGLDPARPYGKRKALMDLRIDEESYEIEQLTEKQALDELEALKDELPAWMWKEIVRLTDLRLKNVKNVNWEQLSPEEADDLYTREMAAYREILNKWKRDHLTGWREEHERSQRMIVTRAVCNEVAEHIQHLRGHKPPGGLTAKPEWYLRKEKDPILSRQPDKPYLTKALQTENFKSGASILWLRWVNSEPNAWRITRPLTLRNGEGLLPREVSSSGWSSGSGNGNAFTRSAKVTYYDDKGKPFEKRETHWLRWIHEATVVVEAETADGPTVLTFETALPYEERRQSTIGVFKHLTSNLKYLVTNTVLNGTFVGYIPEGQVPYSTLKELLDWNRVLRRNAFSGEEIQAFWKRVVKPVSADFSFAPPRIVEEVSVEAAPILEQEQHQECIHCYELDPTTGNIYAYQPTVELRRGAILSIDKASPVRAENGASHNGDEQTYYQVLSCISEPRAQDLYIRASEIIEAHGKDASMPVKALAEICLWRISHADEMGKPIFQPAEDQGFKGTIYRLSTVHKISEHDQGDGIIHAGNGQAYYLIIACPRNYTHEGYFIRQGDFKPVTEKQYLKEKIGF
jgi:hypothetical protein